LSVSARKLNIEGVKCPYCHREIDDSYVRSHVAKQLGSKKTPAKKKDPKRMAELGRLGAAKRWGKQKGKKKT
jgi:hypothetical protein